MAKRIGLPGFLIGSSLLALLGGCALHMPLSGDLASKAQEMRVQRKHAILTNRIKWVHFGPYNVEDIRIRGKATDRKGGFGHTKMNTETRYGYRVQAEAGIVWTCDCLNRAEREDYFPLLGRARELGYLVTLECGLTPSGGGVPWKMTLIEEDSSGNDLRGNLSDGVGLIEVSGTHAYQGRKVRSPQHTGFLFQDVTGPLGAVELLGKQKVLLQPQISPEKRSLLAAVSASLLLYEDLNERMKEEMRNKSGTGLQVVSADP
ncbi:MAG TPA: hypothetical protein VJ385_03750 [Fibrobacteria bacterium]|nr:hypothetical protein [Fibrobacteria bacterium]